MFTIPIYQPIASGPLRFLEGRNEIHSKRLFLSKADAEAYCEEFKATCCGSGASDLDPAKAVVYVRTLELAGDERALHHAAQNGLQVS